MLREFIVGLQQEGTTHRGLRYTIKSSQSTSAADMGDQQFLTQLSHLQDAEADTHCLICSEWDPISWGRKHNYYILLWLMLIWSKESTLFGWFLLVLLSVELHQYTQILLVLYTNTSSWAQLALRAAHKERKQTVTRSTHQVCSVKMLLLLTLKN